MPKFFNPIDGSILGNAASATVLAGTSGYATTAQAAFPGYRVACWGDSITEGYQPTFDPALSYPARLATLAVRDVYNGGVGGDTCAQIRARMVATTATTTATWSHVIWGGYEDMSLVSEASVVAEFATMAASLSHTRYLILGITNNSSEPAGNSNHTKVLSVNATLASTYGARFVDMRSYLVSLYNPGIPQDVSDHANDLWPTSLSPDGLHLNTAGYLLVAQRVMQAMSALDGPAAPLSPAGLATVMRMATGVVHAGDPIGVDSTGGDVLALNCGTTCVENYFAGISIFSDNLRHDAGGWHFLATGAIGQMLFLTTDGFHYYTTQSCASLGDTPAFVESFACPPAGDLHAFRTVSTGSGATGARPTGVPVGARWFDTQLGKPIWWNGSAWVDATGTTV